MIFESLKVENVMGCVYEIEFDPSYTVIIGKNRQGKTLVARLIMLALYGTGKDEKELHNSWKLKLDELLPISEKGSVDLIIRSENKRYRIYREFGKTNKVIFYVNKDDFWEIVSRKNVEIKSILEEEIGITPRLMNIVMSNERSLIGTISYDEKLQADVWEGWKWKTEIIRNNLKKAQNKCSNVSKKLMNEIEELENSIKDITNRWVEKEIFKHEDISSLDSITLQNKLYDLKKKKEELDKKLSIYTCFYDNLIGLDDLENEEIVLSILDICDKNKKFLDEKDEVEELKIECMNYLNILNGIKKEGGMDKIQKEIERLYDEEEKLKLAKKLKYRRRKHIEVKCVIYPPENGEELIVQIPEDLSRRFKYIDIKDGKIAVPYDEEKENKVIERKNKLENMIETFEMKRKELRMVKNKLRDIVGKKLEMLRYEKTDLESKINILDIDKDRYLSYIEKIREKRNLLRKLNVSKKIFGKLYDSLDEEENLRKIRKETVSFINRIYGRIYGWDINARLDENRIIVTDLNGNIRSHPSGSEIHIMGLAWRWMIARSFDLPLILDELDALLDESNFEKTKRLIEEEMNRQIIILTLKESLKDLEGRIYKVLRENEISTVVEVK